MFQSLRRINKKYKGICLLTLVFSSSAYALVTNEPAYFIFDGNPVSAKYVSGRLIRIPVQDADNVEGLKKLEAVSALLSAPRLSSLSKSAQPLDAQLSPPHLPEYGQGMFNVTVEGSTAEKVRPISLVWSGSTLFHEITLRLPGLDKHQKQLLIADSRRVLTQSLDLRNYEPVGRRLKISGPVKVRDFGRADVSPHLAFVDITWRIKDLPKTLSDKGIDSWSPFLRVEYVVNSQTGITIYRNVTNVGGIEDRDMRLFKEPKGPLLMAVLIDCTDGSEPLIIDLENESYGTGRKNDVPEVPHCFPAQ